MKHPVIYAFSAGVAVGSVGTGLYITYRILLNDTMYAALKDATVEKTEKLLFGEPTKKTRYSDLSLDERIDFDRAKNIQDKPEQSSGRL